ncbi:MAG: 8-oxoguanine glycosylase domain protein [Verrucomicrobiales bacterium]|nr:8-oxoguanine glycosylase domain protein [Verrucomicrobiales bacterium]
MSRTHDRIALTGWPFDLAATLNSGQVFHWHRLEDGGFAGLIGSTPVGLSQPSPDLLLCTRGTASLVRHYLALDHDLPALAATFPADDEGLRRAVAWCPGLRILRQPPWECLATFITSSLKQVPHIRQISLTLRQRFGAPVSHPGLPDQWAYPSPAVLASAGENALRACGLGYRAAFLHRTARDIAEGRFDLSAVAALPDDEARAALCMLHGVGEKIANCALLFGWERAAAFPIDVWVERVLRCLYFGNDPAIPAKTLRRFAAAHFGPSAGYAQQFLFHHARLSGALNLPEESAERSAGLPPSAKRKSSF